MAAATATATSAFAAAEATARSKWAAWAATLADGGSPPPPLELLEAGALLRVQHPAAALEEDAAAISEVRQLEAQAEAGRRHIEASLEPFGGEHGIQERISELKAELQRLEQLASPWRHIANTGGAGRANKIRREHPRAFPVAEPASASKSKSAARSRSK